MVHPEFYFTSGDNNKKDFARRLVELDVDAIIPLTSMEFSEIYPGYQDHQQDHSQNYYLVKSNLLDAFNVIVISKKERDLENIGFAFASVNDTLYKNMELFYNKHYNAELLWKSKIFNLNSKYSDLSCIFPVPQLELEWAELRPGAGGQENLFKQALLKKGIFNCIPLSRDEFNRDIRKQKDNLYTPQAEYYLITSLTFILNRYTDTLINKYNIIVRDRGLLGLAYSGVDNKIYFAMEKFFNDHFDRFVDIKQTSLFAKCHL